MKPTPPLSATIARMKPAVFARLQGRIDELTKLGRAPLPLHIGDTHRAPPAGARRVLESLDGADASLFRYGPTAGLAELRRAFAARLSFEVDADDEILLGNGATHALFCAARSILDAGDEVLVASPYWPLAPGIFTACGAVPVEVPLTQALYADPSLDAGALLAAKLGPRTKALYVISPNNPDGKVLSRRDLESIARVAIEHDLWVIADEVYADTRFDAGERLSIAELEGMRSRTLVVHSLSKSHALAGLRVGAVAAPPEVVAAARRVSTHTAFNVPVALQRAALAALEDDAFPRGACADDRRVRDRAEHALAGLPVAFHRPEGGTYFFLDFAPVFARLGTADTPTSTEPVAPPPLVSLLERAVDRGVLLAPGDAFGRGWEACARLCFTAVSPDEVLTGIARLGDAIDALLHGRP